MPVAQKYDGHLPIRMLYTGSLIIGRDRSLLRLSEALKKVNRGRNLIKLDVYTQTAIPEELLMRIEHESCQIHEPIPQNEVLKKQNEADILVFLEDLDGKDAKVARLSFSTKITDYLSTGKCILAIGNTDTAPMQYFIDNHAAIVCGNEDDIFSKLMAICSDSSVIDDYARYAVRSAKQNHDPVYIRQLFDQVVRTAAQSDRG